MNDLQVHKKHFDQVGYVILNDIFSPAEIEKIGDSIEAAESTKETFRRSEDLFAIRQFLREVPGVFDLLFTKKLLELVNGIFGEGYFVTKSIYFDKPGSSNWYVAYHQDLTISVDKKTEIPGFGPWTVKQDQFAVQPPLQYLQDNFTIRIHLDSADEQNGALKVIPGTHKAGIFRPGKQSLPEAAEDICKVMSGGIMLMHPLLMHGSGRTTNSKQRRVIHIEFSNKELPDLINWSERMTLN